jgi:hypothetical protein
MTLAELQSAFQEAILGEAQEMPSSIMASRQQTAAERFGIYSEAYRLRLAEFISSDYPVLRNVLGDEDFDALACAYIEANPSTHRNARWYARGLPDFMQTHAPWQETSIGDLASFERALADAFDAADADPIDVAALAGFAAEDQPRLRFTFQPGLTLLSLAQGIAAAHEAVLEGIDAPPPAGSDDERLLVWRHPSLQSFYRVLDEDEALALESACAGATFAEICGLLSLRMEADAAVNQAALFLVRWFADGLITGLELHGGL